MEIKMLQTLDYNIDAPSSYFFLQRFGKIGDASPKQFNLAQYFLELSLMDSEPLKFCPSNQAASALYLALKILSKEYQNNQGNQGQENIFITTTSFY